jgi:pyruvate-ferredoxin/flavodoxin oxidoreductase
MTEKTMAMIDGNEATASVAHRINEVCAIYPITPSSNMGEFADEWSAQGRQNIWGTVPDVIEMQSEGGAAGAVHGSLQAGALTTTFTASQGLLLMIPNMYKIAGELTSTVFHVSARTVATHALSIFGDHSDVMACRQTGFGMLCGGSVQEAHDFACIAQMASLASRIPFIHFFDGFRTSHEVSKIELLSDDQLRGLMDEDQIRAHRDRALSPDRPVIRGTAQNPDTFFQAREAINGFYDACPGHRPGSHGSLRRGGGTLLRTLRLRRTPRGRARGGDHGLRRRGRPRDGRVAERARRQGRRRQGPAVSPVRQRGVPEGAAGDRHPDLGARPHQGAGLHRRTPLPGRALDLRRGAGRAPHAPQRGAGHRRRPLRPVLQGVHAGDGQGVFDNLAAAEPKNHFTVGIVDDVSHTSLDVDDDFDIAGDDVFRGLFFGLGSDGTVGANKNSIKIIGEETDNYAQGYFVYDSKKAGAVTVSHLRFGQKPIRSTYLIKKANFVACHQWVFLEKYDMLEAQPGATFLINTLRTGRNLGPPAQGSAAGHHREEAEGLLHRRLPGGPTPGMGRRINTIMQTCFFAISGILPRDEAIAQIKKAIEKTYGKKGDESSSSTTGGGFTLANLHEMTIARRPCRPPPPSGRPSSRRGAGPSSRR